MLSVLVAIIVIASGVLYVDNQELSGLPARKDML